MKEIGLELISGVIIFALFNTSIMLLMYKWKIIELYELYKKDWMPSCNFCFYFWLAVIEYLIYDWRLIGLALCCAVVSRKFE